MHHRNRRYKDIYAVGSGRIDHRGNSARNRVNHSTLWDYPSVAILARSLIETAHRYLYLLEPGISKEEVEFRQQLHFYRINCEKFRLYSEKQDHEILKEFEKKLPLAKAKDYAVQRLCRA